MGRVWLAHDELLDRPVAVKQGAGRAWSPGQSHREARARALTEARAAARVRHDGIVTVYDIARDDDWPWIVMEPLTGETLAQRLQSRIALPIGEAARLGLRLLDVLEAIHAAGIIHRDIKPANIQLCTDGRIVLTDFGIASIAGQEPPLTVAGSPSYISPEQLRGEKPEPAADLFSLGATLFAAVEGRPPFDEVDVHATLTATMHDDRAPMLRAGGLRTVIAGLLAHEPRDRLSSAAARVMLVESVSAPDRLDRGGGLLSTEPPHQPSSRVPSCLPSTVLLPKPLPADAVSASLTPAAVGG